MKEEFLGLAQNLRVQADSEVDSRLLFNFSTINIMWSYITGKRFDRDVPADYADVDNIEEVFMVFGGRGQFTFRPHALPSGGPERLYRHPIK